MGPDVSLNERDVWGIMGYYGVHLGCNACKSAHAAIGFLLSILLGEARLEQGYA